MPKKKQKDMFIIVAENTPYPGIPYDLEDLNSSSYPDLPTSLREAQNHLIQWQGYDAQIGAPDDPPMDFKIYKLVEVK